MLNTSFISPSKSGYSRRVAFLLRGLLLMIVLLGTLLSVAQTAIHVPADQPTIQAAIDAASNGDTVLVAPGTYYENITFNGKAITVKSSDGPSVTTIDGGRKASVVTFQNSETAESILDGFTITNGHAPDPSGSNPDVGGGGIFVSNASPQILNNVVAANVAFLGSGIAVNGASGPAIKGNIVRNNFSEYGVPPVVGCGLWAVRVVADEGTYSSLEVVISDNQIVNNCAGGLYVRGRTVTIQNNVISGNTSGGWGLAAGVTLSHTTARVINNLITRNRTLMNEDTAGGIYYEMFPGDDSVVFLNNTIADNEVPYGIPAVYGTIVDGPTGDGSLANSQFFNNIIVGKPGWTAFFCQLGTTHDFPLFNNNDIFAKDGAALEFTCGNPLGQNGNISTDPMFVAPHLSNYRLQRNSPGIDAGDNSFAGIPSLDLAGFTRILDGNSDGVATIDMGAYEYSKTTVTVTPGSLPFSSQLVGSVSAPKTVTVANTGDAILYIASITIPDGFSQTNSCEGTGVAPGQSCEINVTFAPNVAGSYAGELTIVGNFDDLSPIPVTGYGLHLVKVSPLSLSYPATTVGMGAGSQKVTFTNTGSEAVALTPTISGPFAIWENYCTGMIASGASCAMLIGYVPQVGGAETGTLSVAYTGGAAPLTVALSGTGIAKIQVSPGSLTFPATNIGSGTSAQRVGVLNRTGANITITPAITGSFYISTNGCAGTLAPNSACYIFVNYLASASGQQTGQLTITPSVGSAETVSLTGTGVGGGDIEVSPAALTFAATNVGSATSSQRVGVLNRTGTNVTITPALTGSFRISVNTCTGTIAPNNGCYVFVQYRPTAVGQQTGALTVTPTVGTVHEVSLTGTGQ